MFRIRRVYDDLLPLNRRIIGKVQETLREQFSEIRDKDVDSLPEKLRDPMKHQFRALLLVADEPAGHLKGFALLYHAPDLNFTYLDYVAAAGKMTGRGIGGALYQRVREESRLLGSTGLFFECLPDDPNDCPDGEKLKQNKARLRFYERYGARPLIGNDYTHPPRPGDTCNPYLVYDDLGSGRELPREEARQVVRAILERKYGDLCTPEYLSLIHI